jgi:hypothetical protein
MTWILEHGLSGAALVVIAIGAAILLKDIYLK